LHRAVQAEQKRQGIRAVSDGLHWSSPYLPSIRRLGIGQKMDDQATVF
jgi:hypothetical protein